MDDKTSANDFSLALIGSGGAGVMTAGQVLLDAAVANGWYGLMTRSTGPQIRGGEAAAILRLDQRPVDGQADRIDLLVALDFEQAERFASELILDEHSRVLADPAAGPLPGWIESSGAELLPVPFSTLVAEHRGVRVNSIAIGLVTGLLGLDPPQAQASLTDLFQSKGSRLLDSALAGLKLGLEAASGLPGFELTKPPAPASKRWLLTGNEAIGYGALAGGIRFCAAYPITPSTEIQEWLAGALPTVGGALVQAEDELASINMVIGASFGGTPAMTATSGPGLSLMIEALGLATAAEVPLLVVDVMRGGPSTGIPTKSEQSDLNLALFGVHGDAPRLVLAPNSLADCASSAQWSVELAERLQCPALLLSDQFLGQARAVIDAPALAETGAVRKVSEADPLDYRRFALTADGISPMAIPGTPGGAWTATGLSHQTSGRPSTLAADHWAQLEKRKHKLEAYDYGPRWADIEGNGETAIISFGSITGTCREACARLLYQGHEIRLISLRLLSPLRRRDLVQALQGVNNTLVVEQNHGGQLYRYLRAELDLPGQVTSLANPGPLPFRPGEIVDAILELNKALAA